MGPDASGADRFLQEEREGRPPVEPARTPPTVRQQADAILKGAGWELSACPIVWSPRMRRCAGLFVVEKDRRGVWHPEIRLSIPLLRRRDWPWPQQVCGCNCRNPEEIVRRILEHELIHYKLWKDGVEWGHTEAFRQLAWEAFHHSSITHGIGDGE
jgi:hypothetical protein